MNKYTLCPIMFFSDTENSMQLTYQYAAFPHSTALHVTTVTLNNRILRHFYPHANVLLHLITGVQVLDQLTNRVSLTSLVLSPKVKLINLVVDHSYTTLHSPYCLKDDRHLGALSMRPALNRLPETY